MKTSAPPTALCTSVRRASLPPIVNNGGAHYATSTVVYFVFTFISTTTQRADGDDKYVQTVVVASSNFPCGDTQRGLILYRCRDIMWNWFGIYN